jgi:hypothetical protein
MPWGFADFRKHGVCLSERVEQGFQPCIAAAKMNCRLQPPRYFMSASGGAPQGLEARIFHALSCRP